MNLFNRDFWLVLSSVCVSIGAVIALLDPFLGFFVLPLAILLIILTLVAVVVDLLWNTQVARYFLTGFIGTLLVIASAVATYWVDRKIRWNMANNIVHQLEWSKATRGKYPGSLNSIRDAQGFQEIHYEVYENGSEFKLVLHGWNYQYYDSEIGEWRRY